MEDDERELVSKYTYVGAVIKESLESGLNGTFVAPPLAIMEGFDNLFQNALAAVSEDYRNDSSSLQHALYYSMMLGILRTVNPRHLNSRSLTMRLEKLYSALKNNMNPFSMKEDDAESLIDICNRIVEIGESYTYEQYMRNIS